MKIITRKFVFLITIMSIMLYALPAAALPVEDYAPDCTREDILILLDKLSQEYGFEYTLGFPDPDSQQCDVDIAEIERDLIKALQISAEAEENSRKAKTKEALYMSMIFSEKQEEGLMKASGDEKSKKLDDCTAYLTANVSNSSGTWLFTSYISARTSPAIGNTYFTFLNVSSKSLIDGGRTYAITYKGSYTYPSPSGPITLINQSRYCEFVASTWA